MAEFHFNYIITIHNKEKLIEAVFKSVIESAGPNSVIYPVLDGCTDGSESIIDKLIESHKDADIRKIHTPDVHELRSINAGLKLATREGKGFNIVLQDDVILGDPDLEKNLMLLDKFDPLLGVVSLRHGANISRKLLPDAQTILPLEAYVENIKGHNPDPFTVLWIGQFIYREVAIKSPICISFNAVRKAGIPDERYAPWDDLAYNFRVLQSGLHNGVLATHFVSDKAWGTTRQKKQEIANAAVHKKNLDLFRTDFTGTASFEESAQLYNSKQRFTIFSSNDPTRFYPKDYFSGFKRLAKRKLKSLLPYATRTR